MNPTNRIANLLATLLKNGKESRTYPSMPGDETAFGLPTFGEADRIPEVDIHDPEYNTFHNPAWSPNSFGLRSQLSMMTA